MNDEYLQLVRQFREVTSVRWPNGHCCQVTKPPDNVPMCNWQLLQGAPLEFTEREKELLGWPSACFDGSDLSRKLPGQGGQLKPEAIAVSLELGVLADTLECGSHPTRPVLDASDRVTAVVAVPDCNADLLVGTMPQSAWITLWQVAVDLVGPKAYYRHQRDDLVLL